MPTLLEIKDELDKDRDTQNEYTIFEHFLKFPYAGQRLNSEITLIAEKATIWTSTPIIGTSNYVNGLAFSEDYFAMGGVNGFKSSGYSVRCIKK